MAVVAVPTSVARVIVSTSLDVGELVTFQPELPTPLNEKRVEVTWEDTVLVRVMCIVDVRSGLMKLVEVDTSAGGEMVVV